MSIHLPPGVIHMAVPTMGRLMPDEWKEDGYGGCCWGSAMRGAEFCTCWDPVFDVEQVEPTNLVTRDEVATRTSCCADCAYRSDSPERTGDEFVEENLLDLANGEDPFWCHQGMRKPVAFVHPDGRRIDVPESTEFHDYQPPEINGVPYKADGTPGDRCGGWAARRRSAE